MRETVGLLLLLKLNIFFFPDIHTMRKQNRIGDICSLRRHSGDLDHNVSKLGNWEFSALCVWLDV